PPPAETPELFTGSAPPCPRDTATQALAFAREQMELASSRRERMPFRVTDGVQAVQDYQVAAACFKLGKADQQAKVAAKEAEVLKADITNDFRARRLRLSQMLKVEDFELAQKDVRVLQALTEGQDNSYSKWLARTD